MPVCSSWEQRLKELLNLCFFFSVVGEKLEQIEQFSCPHYSTWSINSIICPECIPAYVVQIPWMRVGALLRGFARNPVALHPRDALALQEDTLFRCIPLIPACLNKAFWNKADQLSSSGRKQNYKIKRESSATQDMEKFEYY